MVVVNPGEKLSQMEEYALMLAQARNPSFVMGPFSPVLDRVGAVVAPAGFTFGPESDSPAKKQPVGAGSLLLQQLLKIV